MSSPLKGIKILDLTHMLAGPYGTMLLADLEPSLDERKATPHPNQSGANLQDSERRFLRTNDFEHTRDRSAQCLLSPKAPTQSLKTDKG